VPTAEILGAPDLHVDKGSTINLTCIIKYSPEPPAYIFWYHHDEVNKTVYFSFLFQQKVNTPSTFMRRNSLERACIKRLSIPFLVCK
jgi:hypothetical protein